MKKKLFTILTAFMLLTYPLMAESVALLIDGHKVQSRLEVAENELPDLEVPAQVINGVTLVPLRFIAESMCATVNYEQSTITLSYLKDVLKLTIGKKQVIKNGEKINDLTVAPVIKNQVTLVPLRFIAETFGAKVNYANGQITIDTPAVISNGVKIGSLQNYVAMTMGGYLNEAGSNPTIKKTLSTFDLSAKNAVQPPTTYTNSYGQAMDLNCCYFTSSYYRGLDAQGNELFKYEIYQLLNNYDALDLPDWLLHDVKTNQWYRYDYPNEDFGFWKQIFNNVA